MGGRRRPAAQSWRGASPVVARYGPPSPAVGALRARCKARCFVSADNPTSGTAATKTRPPELGHRANCEDPLLKVSVRDDPRRSRATTNVDVILHTTMLFSTRPEHSCGDLCTVCAERPVVVRQWSFQHPHKSPYRSFSETRDRDTENSTEPPVHNGYSKSSSTWPGLALHQEASLATSCDFPRLRCDENLHR